MTLTPRFPKLSGMTLILAGPLVAMSWHIFEVYSTDILPVRVFLAVSFDLIIIGMYRYLTDEKVSGDETAYRVLWIAIGVVAVFQIYVNITVYLNSGKMKLFDSIMLGGIFPTLVNLVAFVDARRNNKVIKAEEKQARKIEKLTTPRTVTPTETAIEELRGRSLSRDEAKSWLNQGYAVQQLRRASNWRSIQRWAENGQI